MSKVKAAFSLEGALVASGVNVVEAKKALETLDKAFGGQHGVIPDGALSQWISAHFDSTRQWAFFYALGRAWEDDMAATLPTERKAERELTPEEWIKLVAAREAAKAKK